MSSNPACQGCYINPNFNQNFNFFNPDNLKPNCLDFFNSENFRLNDKCLTTDEKDVLKNLLDAWQNFVNLPLSLPDDVLEFKDAIHRCQQIIALRVARRIDEDVWRQPTVKEEQEI